MRHYQRGIGTSIILIIFLIAGVAIASSSFVFYTNAQKLKAINSFEDCAKYYPVMESYPEQCNTSDGKHFTKLSQEDELTKELESLNNRTYKYDGEYFEGIFYKFKYPPNYKGSTGAYGCFPIIIRPEDKSAGRDSICVIEDTSLDKDLEGLVNLGYGETLVSKENINVKGHRGVLIETKRDREPYTHVIAAVSDVPVFLRGMKPKIETGALVFSYATSPERKENAKQVLQQILNTLQIQTSK